MRSSKAANIIDESKLDPAYLIAQPPKIDKAAIRKALTSGETVDGAELKINFSISIK